MELHEAVRAATFPWARRVVRRHIGFVDGLQNIPAEGAFVLVPNHTSYFDHFIAVILIELVRGVPLWILTKEESFRRAPRRLWTRAWYGIPVNRDSPSPSTIRAVQHALKSSEGLGVYPEGTRGSGSGLLPFKAGAFRFALKNGVPVIPMAMLDSNRVLPPGSLRFRKGRVTVVLGAALWPDTTLARAAQATDLAARSREAVESLLIQGRENRAGRHSERIAGDGSRLIDRIVTDHLDDQSRLSGQWRRRVAELTNIFLAASPGDSRLHGQRVRIAGLRVAAAPAIARLVASPAVRRRAERVLRLDPHEATAHYVLGRWHLAAPRLFGASPRRAEVHFRQAVRGSTMGETRALVGLGDSLAALGRNGEAHDAFTSALAATSGGNSRDLLRTVRLEARIAALAVRHAERADH